MRPGEEGSENVRESSLGKVSVVSIARAVVSQESWEEESSEWAVGILARIFEIGSLLFYDLVGHWLVRSQGPYRCPITPVLMTRVLGSLSPLSSSTLLPMLVASSRPPLPVTALAEPVLITTDRIP